MLTRLVSIWEYVKGRFDERSTYAAIGGWALLMVAFIVAAVKGWIKP